MPSYRSRRRSRSRATAASAAATAACLRFTTRRSMLGGARLSANGALVAELRVPVAAAAFRREVEHVPERPHQVVVPRVLAFVLRRIEHLAAVEMTHLAVAPDEDVHHRQLRALFVLAVIVAVVARARRGEQPQGAPAAAVRVLDDALDWPLRHYHPVC